MRSEDLLASVFPDQVACAENLVGEREIPTTAGRADPATIACTTRWTSRASIDLLQAHGARRVRVVARDLTGAVAARRRGAERAPYASSTTRRCEERRTQAVQSRRWQDPEQAGRPRTLDADAIVAVRAEAWPEPRDVEEIAPGAAGHGFRDGREVEANPPGPPARHAARALARRAGALAADRRACGSRAERVPEFRARATPRSR
jgi:ATP-dependent Lhr-like helicase